MGSMGTDSRLYASDLRPAIGQGHRVYPLKYDVYIRGRAAMSKTLIDVDDDLLDQAQAALGAKTKKETVNRALAEAVASMARKREVERLDGGVYAGLGAPSVMEQAWR